MVKRKRSRKIGVNKRRLNPRDPKIYLNSSNSESSGLEIKKKNENPIRELPNISSGLFFSYNSNLKSPYQIIIDTNFINFSIQHKIDILESMMNCLLGICIPCVTDCVIGEIEKMGHRFRLALKLAHDPRFRRLKCLHKGTYADDCIIRRITEHKCYIVATNDKELKMRIRKIPGVPIMYVTNRKYAIERLPSALSDIPLGRGSSKKN